MAAGGIRLTASLPVGVTISGKKLVSVPCQTVLCAALPIARHIKRIGIGLLQDRRCFAHGLRLVDARGKAHQRSTCRLFWQAITVFAPDLNDQCKDLLTRYLFGLLWLSHVA